MDTLFRAWYKGKMWNVETLYLGKPKLLGARLDRVNEAGEHEWDFINTGDFKLMRSTGLFDKNKKLIFEGDIIKYRYMGVDVFDPVKYDEERGGFPPFIGVLEAVGWMHVGSSFVEVTGNIYENPILKKQTAAT